MKKLVKTLWYALVIVMLASCGSLKKADLESGIDPKKAIAEVKQILWEAQQNQIDLGAYEEYTKGRLYLLDAKKGLKNGEAADKVLENAAISKAFLQDADKLAKSIESIDHRIMNARKSALSAGVRRNRDLIARMVDIDDDFRSSTKLFSKSLSPEDYSDFLKRYLVLEVQAVQHRELNSAKLAMTKADDDDAEDLAPKTLRTAMLDYETAMNIIARSPRNQEVYQGSVDTALTSAAYLVDVMNVILGDEGTPESIAVQIVNQKHALGELNTNVGRLQANLKSTEQTLQQKEGELQRTEGDLKSQVEKLAEASTQVRFQQAMNEVQMAFSPDDALVYQQGNKLIFRLKRINFATGTAAIPKNSKKHISKINDIIKTLDANLVVVQGHTDSIGSSEVNLRLSTQRATEVANFLSSISAGYKIQFIGYGESHPIAPNETQAGRSTNRRVDLVVSVK